MTTGKNSKGEREAPSQDSTVLSHQKQRQRFQEAALDGALKRVVAFRSTDNPDEIALVDALHGTSLGGFRLVSDDEVVSRRTPAPPTRHLHIVPGQRK